MNILKSPLTPRKILSFTHKEKDQSFQKSQKSEERKLEENPAHSNNSSQKDINLSLEHRKTVDQSRLQIIEESNNEENRNSPMKDVKHSLATQGGINSIASRVSSTNRRYYSKMSNESCHLFTSHNNFRSIDPTNHSSNQMCKSNIKQRRNKFKFRDMNCDIFG